SHSDAREPQGENINGAALFFDEQFQLPRRVHASPQENAVRSDSITRTMLVVRRSPIGEQGDEPEQQDSAEEQRTDMLMAPRVLCCRSEAAHVPVSNPNRFPNAQPQLTRLESKKTDRHGS